MESCFTKPSPNSCVYGDEWIELTHTMMQRMRFEMKGENFGRKVGAYFEAHKEARTFRNALSEYFLFADDLIGQSKTYKCPIKCPELDYRIVLMYLRSRLNQLGGVNAVIKSSTSWLFPKTSKQDDKYLNDSWQLFERGVILGQRKLGVVCDLWNKNVLSKWHGNVESIIDDELAKEVSEMQVDFNNYEGPQWDVIELPGSCGKKTLTVEDVEEILVREGFEGEELDFELNLRTVVIPEAVDVLDRASELPQVDTSRSKAAQLRELEELARESAIVEREVLGAKDTTVATRLAQRRSAKVGEKRKDPPRKNESTPPRKAGGKKK
jgi:hypothetical protein